MAAFLILLLLTGGSSRSDAPFLFLARGAAVLLAAFGLATLTREERRRHRPLLLLAAATVALTALHLVPLPPALWQALPEHGLVARIDAAAGIEGQWRPLSLVPSKTLNALYALTIPLAALLLAVRLNARDRVRSLYLLLALAGFSASVGLLQAAGVPISFYHSMASLHLVEAAGVFANQNHQAALLALTIPVLVVAARIGGREDGRARFLKPLALGAAGAILVLLVLTGSRAGLALGAAAIGFTLLYGLLQDDRLDRLPQRTAVAIRIALGVAMAAAAVGATVLTSRDLAIARLDSIGENLRPKLWASIMPILPDHQPLGSGIGSYVEVYRWREPTALLRETNSNHAHNEYLEVALTAGLPGLLLLAAAAAMLAVTLWRRRGGTRPADLMARLGATTIVILAAASVTDYPLRTPFLGAVLALAAVWCVEPERCARRGG